MTKQSKISIFLSSSTNVLLANFHFRVATHFPSVLLFVATRFRGVRWDSCNIHPSSFEAFKRLSCAWLVFFVVSRKRLVVTACTAINKKIPSITGVYRQARELLLRFRNCLVNQKIFVTIDNSI